MALEGSGKPLKVQSVNDRRDSIERTAKRQVDAIYSAVSDHGQATPPGFIGRPGRSDLRALGIGRNVDVYA